MAGIEPLRVQLRDGREALLRAAQPEDAEALIRHVRMLLEDGAGQVGLPDELALTPEQEREWIRAHFEQPGWVAVLVEVDGQIAGLLHFENGPRRRIAHRGTLGMGVLRQYRGLGVGAALMRALIEWAEREPLLEKLCLAVLADNAPAMALYRKFGFVEEGRRKREIRRGDGDYVDDILMARFLDDSPPCGGQ